MNLKKVLALCLVTTMSITALAGCGGSGNNDANANSNGDSGEKIIIKIGHVVAEDHPYNLGCQKFKELLEDSVDNVEVHIFANGQLGGERELAESMQLGTLDIAIIPGVIGNFSDTLGVMDMPYLFESKEHAYAVLDGEIGQQLAENLPTTSGFRLLSYWENGYRNMTDSRRAIYSPEDVVGLTMRVPENSVYQAFFEELGANVVAISFSELYTALSQKTVDGQENPVALIATNKLYETQPYLSLTEHFYGAAHFCVSEKSWQGYSAELQEAIQSATEEARDYEREQMAQLESGYVQQIKDAGTEIIEVDKELFKDAAEKTYARFDEEYGDLVRVIQEFEY